MKLGLAFAGFRNVRGAADAALALTCVANGLPASTPFEPEMTMKELLERLEKAQKARRS